MTHMSPDETTPDLAIPAHDPAQIPAQIQAQAQDLSQNPAARRLASFAVPSVPGREREALDQVARSVAGQLPPARLDRLKTAVAEATANAIEHGHGSRPDLDVGIEVYRLGEQVVVTITDRGPDVHGEPGPGDQPEGHPEVPDLARKLAGEQAPRGWGLFLIRHMVDGMDVVTRDGRHIVRLAMRAGGE